MKNAKIHRGQEFYCQTRQHSSVHFAEVLRKEELRRSLLTITSATYVSARHRSQIPLLLEANWRIGKRLKTSPPEIAPSSICVSSSIICNAGLTLPAHAHAVRRGAGWQGLSRDRECKGISCITLEYREEDICLHKALQYPCWRPSSFRLGIRSEGGDVQIDISVHACRPFVYHASYYFFVFPHADQLLNFILQKTTHNIEGEMNFFLTLWRRSFHLFFYALVILYQTTPVLHFEYFRSLAQT